MSDTKVAWITGASSGIGEALARALSRAGWSVILSGRRSDALTALAASLQGASLVLPFETTDYDVLPDVVSKAHAWRGQIDLLVNNAGISQRSLALDTAFDTYRTLMEVDFFAPLRLTQLVSPLMVERRHGRVVAISSLAGRIGSPLRTGYCAAKHAMLGYFDALRAEMEGAYGVAVTTVLPGSVRTGVSKNALQGDGSTRGVSDENIDNGMYPDDVANRILAGISANEREIVIAEGEELRAAGLRITNPRALFDALAKEGSRLAALRIEQGEGFRPDPKRIDKA